MLFHSNLSGGRWTNSNVINEIFTLLHTDTSGKYHFIRAITDVSNLLRCVTWIQKEAERKRERGRNRRVRNGIGLAVIGNRKIKQFWCSLCVNEGNDAAFFARIIIPFVSHVVLLLHWALWLNWPPSPSSVLPFCVGILPVCVRYPPNSKWTHPIIVVSLRSYRVKISETSSNRFKYLLTSFAFIKQLNWSPRSNRKSVKSYDFVVLRYHRGHLYRLRFLLLHSVASMQPIKFINHVTLVSLLLCRHHHHHQQEQHLFHRYIMLLCTARHEKHI